MPGGGIIPPPAERGSVLQHSNAFTTARRSAPGWTMQLVAIGNMDAGIRTNRRRTHQPTNSPKILRHLEKWGEIRGGHGRA